MCFEDRKQEKNMENISVLMHYEYGFSFFLPLWYIFIINTF